MKKEILFLGGVIFVSMMVVIVSFIFSKNLALSYNSGAEFRMGSSNEGKNQYIRDYLLNYNFADEEGFLKFRYWSNYQENPRLDIDIPKELNISSFSFYLKDSGEISNEGFVCSQNTNNLETSLNCNFLGTFNESIIVNLDLIQFSGENFLPNGLFIIANQFDDVTGRDNYTTSDRDVIAEFDLGNKYKCDEPCFVNDYIGNKANENLNYYVENNKIKIYVTRGAESISVPFSIFRLNTYDLRRERNSFLGLAFGISLLAGSIILFLDKITKR